MSVNLSIKNTPDHIVAALRDRARRNHRSLQGELMAIVEAASGLPGPADIPDLLAMIRATGVASVTSSADIAREMRDSRYGEATVDHDRR